MRSAYSCTAYRARVRKFGVLENCLRSCFKLEAGHCGHDHLWTNNQALCDYTDRSRGQKPNGVRRQNALSAYSCSVFPHSIQLTIGNILFYETLIMMLRGETVRFSKEKAKRIRETEANLEKQIVQAEQNLLASGHQDDLIKVELLKNQLVESRRHIIDGLIVRSRVAWHEKGERNTNYFLSLEMRNSTRNSIQYIQDGDKMLHNNAEILDNFSNIYQSKYSLNNDINPRPVRGGWCNPPHEFFWAGRHTVWRIVLKFSIADGASFSQLLVKKKLVGSGQVTKLWRHKRNNLRKISAKTWVNATWRGAIDLNGDSWWDWCQYMTGCNPWHCARWGSRSTKVTWGHWPRLNSQWQITNRHMFSGVSWGAESESVVHFP